MKILQIGDVSGWAISALIEGVNKHLKDRFNIETLYIHPREVVAQHGRLATMTNPKKVDGKAIFDIDLIDYHYWRTATQLRDLLPNLRHIPSVLSHWNHESLEKDDWTQFNALTHPTKYGTDKLREKHPNVTTIPMGIDLDRFSWIENYPPKEVRVGYVGRIAPWKRLHLICEVAKELGYKVIASGYIDKPNYWKEQVEQYAKDGTLEMNGGMGRGEMMPAIFKDNLYKRMTVLVMASEGEYESGPLPAQEAMARGIPVLATRKGTLKDRGEDGKNIVFFDEDNKEDLKTKLKDLIEDEGRRMSIRKKAWETAKTFPEEKMAREFGKLYYKTIETFKR